MRQRDTATCRSRRDGDETRPTGRLPDTVGHETRRPRAQFRLRRRALAAVLAALGAGVFLAACSPITIKHGHHFQESDLQQIQPGMSVEAVRLALGTPATTSTVAGGNAYYYISSTETQSAFFKPTEVDRKVLAVYFNPTGSVDRVAHYGMKDGKIFDYVRRETPSHVRDQGLLKQIFRGLGQRTLFDY